MQTEKKRTALVLKADYIDRIVVRYIDKLGEIKMDTRAINSSEYENYVRMGFGDCFEEVTQEDLTGDSLATAKAEAIAGMASEGKTEEEEEEFEEEEEVEDDDDDDEDLDNADLKEKAEVSAEDSDQKEEAPEEKAVSKIEELEALEWPELKALAKESGMEINGRTKKDAVIKFLMGE